MGLLQVTLDCTGSAVSLCDILTVKGWQMRLDQSTFDYFYSGFHPVMKTELMKAFL